MGLIERLDNIIFPKEKGVKPFGLTPSSLGAETQNRTGDTRIFSPLLYRLSYLGTGGMVGNLLDYNNFPSPVKIFYYSRMTMVPAIPSCQARLLEVNPTHKKPRKRGIAERT